VSRHLARPEKSGLLAQLWGLNPTALVREVVRLLVVARLWQ
jgi:hypothetical protein